MLIAHSKKIAEDRMQVEGIKLLVRKAGNKTGNGDRRLEAWSFLNHLAFCALNLIP